MTQRGVKAFLALYFLIFFGAVFLRVDYFPLSWVPMYGARDLHESKTFAIGDLGERKLGLKAMRANGEPVSISATTLNIPNANFRRLYMQRAFNLSPPHVARERLGLIAFNRWWFETLVGPDPLKNANEPLRLLRSINATLGYGPGDPRRIVQFEARLLLTTFSQARMDKGELSNPELHHAVAVTTEQGTHLMVDGKERHIAGPGAESDNTYGDD